MILWVRCTQWVHSIKRHELHEGRRRSALGRVYSPISQEYPICFMRSQPKRTSFLLGILSSQFFKIMFTHLGILILAYSKNNILKSITCTVLNKRFIGHTVHLINYSNKWNILHLAMCQFS